jgi:aldehyde:ferredoxin oxidoreductase
MGRILHVNLSTGERFDEELEVDYVYPVIGGAGLGIKLLYDKVKPQ